MVQYTETHNNLVIILRKDILLQNIFAQSIGNCPLVPTKQWYFT